MTILFFYFSVELYLMTVRPSRSGNITASKFGWFLTNILKSFIAIAIAIIRFSSPYTLGGGLRLRKSSV